MRSKVASCRLQNEEGMKMLTKIIYKNFRSNLKNYILFFLSNIVAIMDLFVFRGLKEIVLQIVKDTETAFLLELTLLWL